MSARDSVVLLMNCDEEDRNHYSALLMNEGYKVIASADGKETFSYLKADPYVPDILITGVHAPVISGVELLQLIKLSQRLRKIPVVVVLNDESEADVNDLLQIGAEDIIIKPLHDTFFLNRVKNTILGNQRITCNNIMEDIVGREIEKHIETYGICKCRMCKRDLLAMSLNRIKPRYVSTEKGKLISEIEKKSNDNMPDIVRVIADCALTIKKNPRHMPHHVE
ncbi:MAG: response regulator [Lachnospiraceae bacterium]|nr:response regulator [Lachnospiraceae bacterium]